MTKVAIPILLIVQFIVSCSQTGNVSPFAKYTDENLASISKSQLLLDADLNSSGIGSNSILLVEHGTRQIFLQDLETGIRKEIPVFYETTYSPVIISWVDEGCNVLLFWQDSKEIAVSDINGRTYGRLVDLDDFFEEAPLQLAIAPETHRLAVKSDASESTIIFGNYPSYRVEYEFSIEVETLGKWSNNGELLPFSAFDASGNLQLHILNIETKSVSQITEFSNNEIRGINFSVFAWSVDEMRLAFLVDNIGFDTSGNEMWQQIWVYNVESQELELILESSHPYPIFMNTWWTLDQNLLLFSNGLEEFSNTSIQTRIYMHDIESGGGLSKIELGFTEVPLFVQGSLLGYLADGSDGRRYFIRYDLDTQQTFTYSIPYMFVHEWFPPPPDFLGEKACDS